MDDDHIELSEAARLCGVAPRVLRGWLGGSARGRLRGRRGLVRKRDARRALEERDLPVPPGLEAWPKVMIAEDDRRVAWLEARVVRGLWPDAEVREITDGVRASTELTRFRPDLLILDVDLPGATGLEVCASARRTRGLEKVRILMLTGMGDVDTNERALLAGVDEFMTKPFSMSDLERAARRLIRMGPGTLVPLA